MVQHPRRAVARVPSDEGDTALLAADRARLIERVSVGLAHEGSGRSGGAPVPPTSPRFG